MDYTNIGTQILNIDPSIRFVTIYDIENNTFVFSEHKPGVTNLLTKEESQHSLQIALNSWKMRRTLEKKIGKGKFVLAEYERINRITMPLDENHLLYLTTEVQGDPLAIIAKIKKL